MYVCICVCVYVCVHVCMCVRPLHMRTSLAPPGNGQLPHEVRTVDRQAPVVQIVRTAPGHHAVNVLGHSTPRGGHRVEASPVGGERGVAFERHALHADSGSQIRQGPWLRV